MDNQNSTAPQRENQPDIIEMTHEIKLKNETIMDFCLNNKEENFHQLEKSLKSQLYELACLYLQLCLLVLYQHFDDAKFIKSEKYYKGTLIPRSIKTVFGEVRYWRAYFKKKDKGGFYPFDAVIGLTYDGFSPLVISLATRLATRMSFGASVLVFTYFHDWSPSSEGIQALVIGMGRNAAPYMEQRPAPENDGEVLIIEVDGKATPTATENELKKRRRKRKKNKSCCKRHRNKDRHRHCHKKGKNKHKKRADKKKNGRSITLVAIYTLKRGEDGLLHGPINKQVWGSYSPRKVMLAWARRQATRRGFPPDTEKHIHIVVDGETCLHKGLSKLFPNATFALDIRHLEEKIWDIGKVFHESGSQELTLWVQDKIEWIYTGKVSELIKELKDLKLTLASGSADNKNKLEKLRALINYMDNRPEMMNYKELIDENLVIASGIIEGAVRHVIGERMDCGGMRWIPERAENLLKLRCIELNGDWDDFFDWGYNEWIKKMKEGEKIMIRNETPEPLENIDAINDCFFDTVESDEIAEAA